MRNRLMPNVTVLESRGLLSLAVPAPLLDVPATDGPVIPASVTDPGMAVVQVPYAAPAPSPDLSMGQTSPAGAPPVSVLVVYEMDTLVTPDEDLSAPGGWPVSVLPPSAFV